MSGPGVERLDGEAGGHRVQRVPPSDKKGRVHSSTITVAVLGGGAATASPWQQRAPTDFRLEWFSGSGCGGQHRNKHMNSARLVHLPSGIVKTAQTRSRENSQQMAMTALLAELDRRATLEGEGVVNHQRRGQVGTGERSDKRRTVRFQDGTVVDHVTGKRMPVRDYMQGAMSRLWR